MSDSEPSPQSSPSPTPSDATLAAALRHAVERIFNAGDLSDLTVKRVRSAAEKQLRLPEGFFKEHLEWKGKSKVIVEAEADAQFAAEDPGNGNASSSSAKKPVVTKPSETVKVRAAPPKKPTKTDSAKRGTKRSSPVAEPKAKKRQKKDRASSSDLEELPTSNSDGESPRKKRTNPTKQQGRNSKGSNIKPKRPIVGEEDEEDAPKKGNDRQGKAKPHSRRGDAGTAKSLSTAKSPEKGPSKILNDGGAASNVSESEMSVVIDEEPAPKARKKRPSDITSSKKTKSSKAKSSITEPKDDDTPEAEIKRLQSWLLKCGIRKVWSRELAPYSTPKSKISHLKQMLNDVGMKGRFSAEKAKQIKGERELKAELEAVQDGARRWGEGAVEDEEDTGPKPRRRLARGLRELDFLGSGGEETE